ncbi:MAG: TerC family protein [Bacteroidota bacterium]
MFDWIYDPQAWVALATLTSLEIVLGIDNIVFISILTGRLPEEQQPRARFLGLALAMGMRIGLLFSIAWVMSLTTPLFTIPFLDTLTGFGESARHGMALLGEATGLADGPAQITGRDLILLVGGVFLVGKATHEIHNKLEGEHEQHGTAKKVASFGAVLFQIALLDIVFSLDSVITAVGMADDIAVMVIAVVIAVGIMMISAGPVSEFVQKHPTVKMLALAFLILIGVTLMAEGMNQHIPKGYIYSAMAFSLFVEVLNLRAKKAKQTPPPVELHGVPVAPPTNPDA